MRKLFAVFLLGLLLISNNGLAVNFSQIELVSGNSGPDNWWLRSDIFHSGGEKSGEQMTCIADDIAYPMPLTPVVGGAIWLHLTDPIVPPEGATPHDPSYFNGKLFSWTLDDGQTTISANGHPTGIRLVPLSSNLTITGDPLQPTLTWSNPDGKLDGFRMRLYERQSDGTLYMKKQWNDITDTAFTVTEDARLEYGKQYVIRVEARDYSDFPLDGLPDGHPYLKGKVLKRSNTEADIPFTPSQGSAEGNVLEMTSGSPI